MFVYKRGMLMHSLALFLSLLFLCCYSVGPHQLTPCRNVEPHDNQQMNDLQPSPLLLTYFLLFALHSLPPFAYLQLIHPCAFRW